MDLDVRTSVLGGFKGEYAVRSFLVQKQQVGVTLASHLIASQLRDRGIEIGCGDVRADLVEHGKLPFERGENGRHTGIARRGRSEVFQSQIPIRREPCLSRPHPWCVAAETGRISR